MNRYYFLLLLLLGVSACSSSGHSPYYRIDYQLEDGRYRYETHEAPGTGKGFGDSYKADRYGVLYANGRLVAVSSIPSIFPTKLSHCIQFPAQPNLNVNSCLYAFTQNQLASGHSSNWRPTNVEGANKPSQMVRLGSSLAENANLLARGRQALTNGSGTVYVPDSSGFPEVAFGIQDSVVNWVTEDAKKITTCKSGFLGPMENCGFGARWMP